MVVSESITNKMLAAALNQVRGRGKVSVKIDGCRLDDLWATGSRVWFEYHCLESDRSSDAQAWYHSHQQVEVLGLSDCEQVSFATAEERAYEAMVLVYRVRFDDGLEWDVFENELLTDPNQFERDDPPNMPTSSRRSDCVHCGFCCRKAPCGWGEATGDGSCRFLIPGKPGRWLCGKFDEINGQPTADVSPAFGAGCCCGFNSLRRAILEEARNG